MGIYEALVWSPAGLAAPGGVTFPPNSASYDADMTAWNDLLPMLTTQMFEGRYIMAIIQARNTGRPWSDEARNFQFKPTEDCMLAAYCVSANLGKPYTSGLCSGDYVKNMMAAAQTGIAVENYRPAQRASTDLFQVFQCSAKGTKLAFRGCLILINSYKKRTSRYRGQRQSRRRHGPERSMGLERRYLSCPGQPASWRTAARRGWLDDPTRVTAFGLVSRPFRRIQREAAAKRRMRPDLRHASAPCRVAAGYHRASLAEA